MSKKLIPLFTRKDDTAIGDTVSFEAIISSKTGDKLSDPEKIVAWETIDNFKPKIGVPVKAAHVLQEMEFRILNIGTFSVSAEATVENWTNAFNTDVKREYLDFSETHPELGAIPFFSEVEGKPAEIPAKLENLIDDVYPQKPPMFFESPLPPLPKLKNYLDVPGDISMILRSDQVCREGITGKGVLVAMPDTGFFKHAFYKWRGYRYNQTIAPDAANIEHDEVGHGTAEAANIFSNAPNIEFIGIKMGLNATLGFKMAVDLSPAIITCSWGWSIKEKILPSWLKPLEAEVIRAVKDLGITVVFSAGNGHYGFPGQMPEVISVGGVYAHRSFGTDDFDLEASNYASSFESKIYPGRKVPDICGLVGMSPGAIYINLPLEPGCAIDKSVATADTTAPDDGWAVISGTSAAAPQIAGICALLKQAQPSLSPILIKRILGASARDVTKGVSAMGHKAGAGFDSATGPGLVDAYKAYQIARSINIKPLDTLPPPR